MVDGLPARSHWPGGGRPADTVLPVTVPEEPPKRAGVISRLADEAEIRWAPRRPHRGARWAGWVLCVALAVTVVLAAVRVGPW